MKFEDVPVRPVMRYTLCECGGRLMQVESAPVLLSFPAQYLQVWCSPLPMTPPRRSTGCC